MTPSWWSPRDTDEAAAAQSRAGSAEPPLGRGEVLQPRTGRSDGPPRRIGAAEQLVHDVQAAGGVPLVRRSLYVDGRPTGVDYEQQVLSANRYGKGPAGKRLTTRVRTWPDLEVRLEAGVPGADVAPRPVPLTDHVACYHPVTEFRDRKDRHEISQRRCRASANVALAAMSAPPWADRR